MAIDECVLHFTWIERTGTFDAERVETCGFRPVSAEVP
jgi:hypothetical protein